MSYADADAAGRAVSGRVMGSYRSAAGNPAAADGRPRLGHGFVAAGDRNVKRYLAKSLGVLSPVRAVDFVFQQRVLPVLRGRGPKFAARMQMLRDRLAKDGLDARPATSVMPTAALTSTSATSTSSRIKANGRK